MKLLRAIALVRLAFVPLALLQLLINSGDFPAAYRAFAWEVLGLQCFLAVALLILVHRWRGKLWQVAALTLVADALVVTTLVLVYSWEPVQPVRSLLFLVVLEASLLFGRRVALLAAAFTVPVLLLAEILKHLELGGGIDFEPVVLRTLIAFALAAGVGQLVKLERGEARLAEERAVEAERLRDDLGRRVDVLEAASRCARALGSSLELDRAFAAFIAELRGLIPLDRTAILLFEGGAARMIATDGVGADSYVVPGTRIEIAGSVLERIAEGETVYQPELGEGPYAEEEAGLLQLGLHSRVIVPLQLGARTIGALSVVRTKRAAFAKEEIELLGLLGRFVAAAVQNIRTFDTERTTVEELRRLSALRADFVSLVSHELRSPLAAVIGSARTLQTRWRELRPDQRDAFLAVIGDETSRLAALVGDVLDTSRLEAGTFGYTFTEVNLADVVREATAAAAIGQDEVRLEVEIEPSLPSVRGDRDRLRQLLDNLLGNAIKYSGSGGQVEVDAGVDNGSVRIQVRDFGPGIAHEDYGLIFEKFGRTGISSDKPGTGLGLFLSRSFAEAHGGTLRVDSVRGEGATFTLSLPALD